MNNFRNGHNHNQELRDKKHFSSSIFEEALYNQPGNSISTKIAKHIFFNTPADNKSEPAPVRKESTNSNSCSIPGILNQITLKYILDFFEVLLKKFRTELNFHVINSKALSRPSSEPHNDPRITMIKSILDFDSFTLMYKKENVFFYKVEAVIDRLRLMVGIIEDVVKKISKENLSKALIFFEEIECLKCLMKNFPEAFFEKDYFRKLCSELWRFMRDKDFAEPNEQNLQMTFDSLKLYIYGIGFPSPHPDDYPLHKAVYSNNLTMVRRICAREKCPVFHSHIEQSDPTGITPLMLAVLLGNKDAALILVNHGANPKLRSYPYARTPLEEAIHRKNRGMIKIMLLATTYIKQVQWEHNKNYLIDFLKKVPDFSFEMSWECDSKIIPFVKKVTPSDVYKVYKRGSSIRIDLSLLGWSKLKFIRGNSSIIFNGYGSEEGKLLMIDHLKKTSADILAEMSSLALENKVDELIKHEQMNSEVKAENVVFKPATTWKGENVKANINGYDCTKYIAKGTFSLLFTKRNVVIDIDAKQFESFDQYFENSVKEALWILENNKGVIDWNDSPMVKIKRYTDCYQAVIKTLFEKDGKENEGSLANKQKSRKGAEMMNISQKKLMKNYTKNIVATIYTSENLPLNMDHFLPILEILSNISPPINRLKGFLEKTFADNKSSFPIKACIPIFFSLNAILSIKGFKFISPDPELFDIQSMLQRTSNKISGYERFRTEGGSDDEHIQQRWQEFMKHDSEEEEVSYTPIKFEYQEGQSDGDSEPPDAMEKNEKLIQSFFKKTGENLVNQDFVDVYASESDKESDEDENLDDFDISEKYRNETLKLSSHGTHIPKTISALHEKFQPSSPIANALLRTVGSKIDRNIENRVNEDIHPYLIIQNKKLGENIHTLKGKSNYKFMGNLNRQTGKKESKNRGNKKESLSSRNFNEIGFSENYRDLQIKKIKKYTLKKQNLLAKASQSKDKIPREEICIPGQLKASEAQNLQKPFKAIKHERTKSLDLPQKHFETFLNNMWTKDV